MIGHLGSRVSALVDGQLDPAETERAWVHVHGCHACRDLIEREGWVKTRLAGLSWEAEAAPGSLKGALLGASPGAALYAISQLDDEPGDGRSWRGMAVLGGGAVGAAMMGVLALGAAPADAPTPSPRAPSAQLPTPSPGVLVTSRRP